MSTKLNDTFLGFDLSTQKLKAVIVDNELQVLHTTEVLFETDLPEFRTTGGTIKGLKDNEYFAPPAMWVKAIDMVLDKLVVEEADLSSVAAISSSAQQHGSVYWSKSGIKKLQNLDPESFLHVQLNDSAFTVARTPIWMDGSAERQCIEMEEAIGGRSNMVQITGSKCYPRFTGPQIRKMYQSSSRCYEDTVRISLVSSFMASIFLNNIAPIDYSDGSGMNLLDINSNKWSDICLNACAPDLESRLGTPEKPNMVLGNIGSFFTTRYRFREDCLVVASTGDNPSAISGMLAENNSLVISMGTSDTVMLTLQNHALVQEGHILRHPTDKNAFMGLLCFRNGSLVRNEFKKNEADNDWNKFNELLDSTPRGNYGNMALHFNDLEIIPSVKGSLRWNKTHTKKSYDAKKGVIRFSSPQIEIRALIEGQMLHHKAICLDMGFSFEGETKIIATGGGSINKSILQVMSDVFNTPVYVQKEKEAALLGAAYRAKYSHYLNNYAFICDNKPKKTTDPVTSIPDPKSYVDFITPLMPEEHCFKVCEPSKDSCDIYTPMLARYREMVEILQTRKLKN